MHDDPLQFLTVIVKGRRPGRAGKAETRVTTGYCSMQWCGHEGKRKAPRLCRFQLKLQRISQSSQQVRKRLQVLSSFSELQNVNS